MVLFITNKEDITTDFLIDKLNNLGESYYRLNSEDLLHNIGINFNFKDKHFMLIDYSKNTTINLQEVGSVYYRRPKLPSIDNPSLSAGENQFVANETAAILEGIYKILKDKYWISPVGSIREAENKLYQLLIAQMVGFTIPDSLVTTLPINARDFFESHKECIIKPIRNGLIRDDIAPKVIFTSLLSQDFLAQFDSVEYCPTFLQNRIMKEADVRVTVVGKCFFPAKINSQKYKETEVDWRKGGHIDLEYEQITIPNTVRQRCLHLLYILGLNFGAFDFILDDHGNYIFLEVNPNGQWAWIENRLGYKISDELVRLLLNRGDHEISKNS